MALSQTVPTGSVAQPVALPSFSLRELAPWALFAFLLGAVVLYFVGIEQGVFSVFSGTAVHEWVHDGRHLLGFPCH